MKNIIAPIKKSEQGNAVANLQDGLLFLLEKAPAIVPDTERGRRRCRRIHRRLLVNDYPHYWKVKINLGGSSL